MTSRWWIAVVLFACFCQLLGCERAAPDGPPDIQFDSSVCVECGMILSDDRFVAATTVEGVRGPEARLFDDYNCQINYEISHPELVVITRWAHDYNTSEWVPTENAWFLYSEQLRTAMASHAAAFANKSDAGSAQTEHGGEIMTRVALWNALQQE